MWTACGTAELLAVPVQCCKLLLEYNTVCVGVIERYMLYNWRVHLMHHSCCDHPQPFFTYLTNYVFWTEFGFAIWSFGGCLYTPSDLAFVILATECPTLLYKVQFVIFPNCFLHQPSPHKIWSLPHLITAYSSIDWPLYILWLSTQYITRFIILKVRIQVYAHNATGVCVH